MILLPSYSRPNDTEATEYMVRLMSPHFKFNLRGRISVISDMNQYNHKEDRSVHLQATGNAPTYREVYWDGVWICDVDDSISKGMVVTRFLKGFLYAYQNNQISLNEQSELEKAKADQMIKDAMQKYDDKIKKLENKRAENIEEALANEAVVQVLKEKKEKNAKKKSLGRAKV